jgi:transcriptional regulator with XRE-family HTH domain
LRQARQARSLSIADIAKALLLSDNQIADLEADQFGAFYTAAYAERAARRYAEYLGVDLSLNGAPQTGADIPVRHEPPSLTPRHLTAVDFHPGGLHTALKLVLGGLAGIALLVVAGIGWTLRRPAAQPAQAPQVATVVDVPSAPAAEPVATVAPSTDTPSAQPVASAPDAAAIPDDFNHRFYLVVTREVVIQATDANGTVLLSGRQAQDMGRRIVGVPPFSVAVSDEESAEIYYRGQRIRPGPTVYDGIAVTVVK